MIFKKKYKQLLLVLTVLFFASCSNPLQKRYSATTYDDDMQEIRRSNKISDEDEEILDKYVMLAKLTGNDIEGKSYDEILERIKVFRENNQQETMISAVEEALKAKAFVVSRGAA